MIYDIYHISYIIYIYHMYIYIYICNVCTNINVYISGIHGISIMFRFILYNRSYHCHMSHIAYIGM